MLRALRNQTQSIFFKIFLGLLICGFALWGVGDLTGGINQKSVLSVQGKEITTEEVIPNGTRHCLQSLQRNGGDGDDDWGLFLQSS